MKHTGSAAGVVVVMAVVVVVVVVVVVGVVVVGEAVVVVVVKELGVSVHAVGVPAVEILGVAQSQFPSHPSSRVQHWTNVCPNPGEISNW